MDVDEHIVTAPGQEITRTGEQIARGTVAGVGTSTNVALRDQMWGLKPLQADAAELAEGNAADPGVMRAADFTLAPHHSEIPISRYPSDITGIGAPPANAKASGDYFIGHDIVAGQDTDFDILAVDELTYPPPAITGPHIQMHRMAVARKTHAPNTAYHLRMLVPGFQGAAPDTLLTFYFGGAYGGSNQGAFCVTFHGSGEAELRARIGNLATADEADPWEIVQSFRFAAPGEVAGRTHSITIEPKGRDRIGITVGSSGAAQTHGRAGSAGPAFGAPAPDPHSARYSVNAFIGWAPGATVTGPGEVRVDVRQDLLLRWQVSRLLWPTTGQLIDHPSIFAFAPYNYVWLQTVTKPYAGGTLTPVLYRDNDPTALISGDGMGNGLWRFNVGVPNSRRSFGVIYNFTSDGQGTPYLQAQSLFMAARTGESVGLKIPFTPNEVTVTGADGHPERATGGFVWEDLTGEGELLRRRARIHSKIQASYLEKVESGAGGLGGSETVLVSNLLDGEIAHCPGVLQGTSDAGYPSPDWRRFEGSMVGVWGRGHDQFNFTRVAYLQGDIDPATLENRAPFTTDVIYQVFSQVLGIPDNELDIPNVPIRLVPSMPTWDDYTLQPKQIPLDYIARLAEQFLGFTLLRDDNAGYIDSSFSARGMWRLRPRTAFGAVHTPLWNFVFAPQIPQAPPLDPNPMPPPTGGSPAGTGYLIPGPIHSPSAYPPNTSFIYRDKDGSSYRDWPEPPEANFIWVIAADDSTKLPDDVGQFKGHFPLPNPKSYNFDPDNPTATNRAHPDFLGRIVPLVVIDKTLGAVKPEDGGTEGACMALAYALMDALGHGRKRFRFKAPLALVADPSDPFLVRRRMPRFDDPVTVNGFPAILSSCQPEGPLKVFNQWAWYEGVYQHGRWDGGNWVVDSQGGFPA